MSAPTWVANGTPDNGVGSITPTWPAGHQADDIGILFVETANQPVSTPAGWTALLDAGVGTAGAVDATCLQTFWKRATSAAESAPTVSDGGDHQRGIIMVFRGAETSGSPFEAGREDSLAVASTAVSIVGDTTLGDERLIVAAVSNATDTTSNQTTAGGWANADLTSVTRRLAGNTQTGNGGGIDAACGVMAVAGTYGATTATLATSSLQGLISFAIIPPGTPPAPPVTEGGIYVATSVKATAGVVSSTTATLDTAAVQARVTIALKPPAAPPANAAPVIAAIPSIVGAVDLPVVFPITATDADDDPIVLTLVDGTSVVPIGAELVEDEGSGNFTFEWTPTSDQAGEWNFFIRADDSTDTTDAAVKITVIAEPDTTILQLALAIAERAAVDAESALALAELLDETQQMNARVIHEVRQLSADLAASQAFMDDMVAQLEEEAEQT